MHNLLQSTVSQAGLDLEGLTLRAQVVFQLSASQRGVIANADGCLLSLSRQRCRTTVEDFVQSYFKYHGLALQVIF